MTASFIQGELGRSGTTFSFSGACLFRRPRRVALYRSRRSSTPSGEPITRGDWAISAPNSDLSMPLTFLHFTTLRGTRGLERSVPIVSKKWSDMYRLSTLTEFTSVLALGCRWHRHTCIAIFVKQVVFLTVNHRGPLPLKELHSTDDTIVWRDPGGSWACLRPVSDYEWIPPSRGCRWHRHTCMWRLCKAGRFSYGESPWTPPLEGTSLHRWNNSVERPWGILSLFTTRFRLRVNSPFQRPLVTQT